MSSYIFIYIKDAFTWVVSQHTDTNISKNIKAKLRCYYLLHRYVGTIFCHDKRLA